MIDMIILQILKILLILSQDTFVRGADCLHLIGERLLQLSNRSETQAPRHIFRRNMIRVGQTRRAPHDQSQVVID